MTARFITLEGGEGVGKSTQVARLADALRVMGHRVVVTREPGGSPGAEAIRGLLLEGAVDRWGAPAEALLFAAARADHVARTIRPSLDGGAWVICDRYLDSSRAYQGSASGIDDAQLLALHAIGSAGLLPDRTLVLTLPSGEAARRIARRDADRGDRIGGRAAEFHEDVTAGFFRIAEREPARVRLVEAGGEVGDVTHRLLVALSDLTA